MSAVQLTQERTAGKLAYIALLFAVCWTACFLLAVGPGHEAIGLLALAGALGSAVFPWIVGGAVAFIAGRKGRPAALAVCLLAVAALFFVPRL